nr:isochorismatase family cysteine hydrolase [Nitratireductor aquibiodomus]
MTLGRESELDPQRAAILFIDVQNLTANRKAPGFAAMDTDEFEDKFGWFFGQLDSHVIANMQALQRGFRAAGSEVIYTTIESQTLDGRDRSLDYKISGFNVPKGSWEGKVLDEIAPSENEIVIPKTSSSVFISTNIDYVLRNLSVEQVVIAGFLTDQCIESAIRDACDLGYLVTQATDACATHTKSRHENSISAIAGYCRQRTTQSLIDELAKHPQRAA